MLNCQQALYITPVYRTNPSHVEYTWPVYCHLITGFSAHVQHLASRHTENPLPTLPLFHASLFVIMIAFKPISLFSTSLAPSTLEAQSQQWPACPGHLPHQHYCKLAHLNLVQTKQ